MTRIRAKKPVWVVMHYEIIGEEPNLYVDALQFHVASSLRKAEAYVRGPRGVASYSWWQVHPLVVDEYGDSDEVHYFSHTGRRLRKAPMTAAFSAKRRYLNAHPDGG
jgi:hypothetical protein